MNLLTLQEFDYKYSCQHLEDLEGKDDKWGLFMHCTTNNDVDSYMMDWVELKTLRDNVGRLYEKLNREVMKELEKDSEHE